MGCNNIGALDKCGSSVLSIKPAQKHFNLHSQLAQIEAHTATQKSLVHVYAHQDTHSATEHLTPMAKLNIKVDHLANQMITQDLPPRVLEHGFPVVQCSGVRISSRMKSSLYFHITSRKFLDYLTSNGKLAEGVEQHVH